MCVYLFHLHYNHIHRCTEIQIKYSNELCRLSYGFMSNLTQNMPVRRPSSQSLCLVADTTKGRYICCHRTNSISALKAWTSVYKHLKHEITGECCTGMFSGSSCADKQSAVCKSRVRVHTHRHAHAHTRSINSYNEKTFMTHAVFCTNTAWWQSEKLQCMGHTYIINLWSSDTEPNNDSWSKCHDTSYNSDQTQQAAMSQLGCFLLH